MSAYIQPDGGSPHASVTPGHSVIPLIIIEVLFVEIPLLIGKIYSTHALIERTVSIISGFSRVFSRIFFENLTKKL